MKRISFGVLTLAIALGAGPSRGQDCGCAAPAPACDSGCDVCDTCDTCDDGCDTCDTCEEGTYGCFEPCCHSSGCYFEAEATFLRFHRAQGVNSFGILGAEETEQDEIEDLFDANGEFSFALSPRLTLGYVGSDGLGMRARYWDYSDEVESDIDGGDVFDDSDVNAIRNEIEAMTFDVELFDTFCLNKKVTLEISGGLRYVQYDDLIALIEDTDADVFSQEFTGYGGIVGLKINRALNESVSVFAQGRGSVLFGNNDVSDNEVFFSDDEDQAFEQSDVVRAIFEIQAGAEARREIGGGAYLFGKAAGEFQTWSDFSGFGTENVGFGGFAFSAGVMR